MAKQSKHDPGKVAEYRLAAELLNRGYTPCWPSTAHVPYDLVLASYYGSIRIQVKASASIEDVVQISVAKKGKVKSYGPKDADLLAIYISDRDVWYFIPISKRLPRTIYVQPSPYAMDKCKYAEYREKWNIFGRYLGPTK